MNAVVQDETLWMVLPYVQGGSVESAMKYAYPKVGLIHWVKRSFLFSKAHDKVLKGILGGQCSDHGAC